MGRYIARELAHYGIDYTKAIISVNSESILFSLSVNSNVKFFKYWENDLYIELVPLAVDKYKKFYQIKFWIISIWFIALEWVKNWSTTAKDFIEITWQGLNIFWLDVYYFLMEEFKLNFIKYKRVDFCFDIFMNMNYFYTKILIDKFKQDKTMTPFIKKWICETVYFGEKNIKQNSYMLVRIYDKIKDSVKKEKLFLYNDRNDEKWKIRDVTRFEIEAREDLCKYYSFESLKDENFVFARLVKSFYKMNTQFFKFIDFEDFHKYSKQEQQNKKQIIYQIKKGNNIKPITKHQDRIQKQLIEQQQLIKYGKTILNQKDLITTEKLMITYAKKLFKAWYSKEKLKNIIENSII